MSLAAIMPKPKEERWKYTDLAGAVRKLAVDEAPSAPLIRVEGSSPLVKSLPGKGLQIDVPAGHVAAEPLKVSIAGVDGHVSEPALAVRLGENAQATLIEIHTGGSKFLNNAATHIILDKGAQLKHFRVQAYDVSGVYVQNTQASIARERCASVCVAMQLVRRRARPLAVAGKTTGLTKTPSSSRRRVMAKAWRSSPTMIGMTGVRESPVQKPWPERPSLRKRVLRQSCSRRSGSASRMSTAAEAAAAEAGRRAAEKIRLRPACRM